MTTLAANVSLPPWADDLRRRYLRGESSQFVVYGNVHDLVLHESKLYTLSEFICEVLLARSKDTIAVYNVSTGVRFTKRKVKLDDVDDLVISKDPAKVLPLLERVLTTNDKIGVLLEYADTIAPAGDTSFSTADDRAACVTLHRWSVLRALENADSIVMLTVEALTELHPKIVSNPRVATVRVPIPSTAERAALIRFLDDSLSDADVTRYAEVTAGLKLMQIRAILAPTENAPGADPKAEREERRKYLVELLGGGQTPQTPAATPTPATLERADKLAAITQGMSKEAIRKLIAPEGKSPTPSPDARLEIDRLIAARKREILERECFGLIEFVTPGHGFEVVGGMDEVKKDLLQIADNIRQGRRNRSPMGLLFTGPMGTGKTFVAEAFARECGLTTIKLKNFRSKWVGATEGNLEKILSVVQAIGQIIVIIDEGDRAFGNAEGEGDGGTSSRVIGRIKEFMSDTENRGRVLFILMTNRPDKLDIDIKRAGRIDRKIPFFYPQTPAEVSGILGAQFRKNKVKSELTFPGDLALCEPIVGYSNADIEAIVLLAADYAAAHHPDAAVTAEDFKRATADYLPSRDVAMIEYMELLAVFEASNRRMLPKKYADLSVEALQAKVAELRLRVGARR